MPLLSNQKVEEMKEAAIRPYIEEISRLKKELEEAHQIIQKYESKLEIQKRNHKNEIDRLIQEDEFLKEEFQKKEANMNDMLDRFASKNFDNGRRHSYLVPHITEWKKVKVKNGYKKVVSFWVLFPIPTNNDVSGVSSAMEYIESLIPDIAEQMNVDSIELRSAVIQKDGWAAKFETVVETVNQRRDLW